MSFNLANLLLGNILLIYSKDGKKCVYKIIHWVLFVITRFEIVASIHVALGTYQEF